MYKNIVTIKMFFFGALYCFVASVSASTENIAYLAYASDFWQVWVMDSSGKKQRQLSNVKYDISRVSWFPDQKHLLINGTQGQLAKVSIETGKTVPVNIPLKGTTDAVISPNGKQIAFSVSTAEGIDTNNIWIVNINGKNLRKITKMGYLQHEPVWSVSGDDIYFLSGDGKQSHNIFKVNVKTTNVDQLTVGKLYHFDLAINSNDELAFSSNRLGNYELFRFTNDKVAKRLTSHPALDGRPSWSPDMQGLIFESTRLGSPNLWYIDLNSHQLKQLTFYKRGARSPVWFQPSTGETK